MHVNVIGTFRRFFPTGGVQSLYGRVDAGFVTPTEGIQIVKRDAVIFSSNYSSLCFLIHCFTTVASIILLALLTGFVVAPVAKPFVS